MAVPTPRPGRDAVAIPEDEAARLHQIIGDLGIPGFVDIHTHFMPSNVLAKVWDYFDRAPEHGLRPWPIAYRYAEPERIDRRSEEHTSELQSRGHLVCRLLL